MPYTQSLNHLQAAFCDNAIECKQDIPLSSQTTFRIGGSVSLIAYPNSRRQLIRVLDLWRKLGDSCPICVIGNGSNVLFPNHGYHGLVVITKNANRIAFEEDESPIHRQSRRRDGGECDGADSAGAGRGGEEVRAMVGMSAALGNRRPRSILKISLT